MSGPGKRLNAEEEARGAQMFGRGASERDVAEALGCSASTAHRLRERLAREAAPAAPADSEASGQAPPGVPGAPEPAGAPEAAEDAELAGLQRQRAEQADVVEGLEQREATSREAMATLDAERSAALAEGHADVSLRERFKNATEDAEDWAKGAALAREKLAGIDRQIQVVLDRQQRARELVELATLVEARDAVLAATGERQRSAVLAVRAAAEDFTAALAEERDAVRRVDELAGRIALGGPAPGVPAPVSTALSVSVDYVAAQPTALLRAVSEARAGNVTAVARQLGECNGWLPPSAELIEAERDRVLALRAQQPPAEAPGPVVHMPEGWGASVSVDQHGNPLRPPAPRPADAYPGTPAGQPAGWLGGQPWPG